MSYFSGMNAKRHIVKQWRLPTKAETRRGFAGKISCQMRHQCGLQWTMHHETTIAFNVTGIGHIVMDTVCPLKVIAEKRNRIVGVGVKC